MSRRRTKIGGQFSWRLVEMLESPAYRVLSLSGRRILDRLEIELAHHGGDDNGKLPTTYEHFCEYGMDRDCIAPGIRECVALGFLEVTEQGVAGNREFRRPNRFRLTYRPCGKANATDEWRRIETIELAQQLAGAARKKQKTSRGFSELSVGETPTETIKAPVGETPTTAHSRKTPTTSISRGGDDAPTLPTQAANGRATQSAVARERRAAPSIVNSKLYQRAAAAKGQTGA